MQLIGGGTTHGSLSMMLGVHSPVPPGRTTERTGTKSGGRIYVTGTPEDNAADLAMLQNRLAADEPSDANYLLAHHPHPVLHVLQSRALYDLTIPTIDLSNGLIFDLGHILRASDCDARIDLDAMPYSSTILRQVKPEQALRWAFTGREDYELCFTTPELDRGALDVALGYLGARSTCIGQITPESEGL